MLSQACSCATNLGLDKFQHIGLSTSNIANFTADINIINYKSELGRAIKLDLDKSQHIWLYGSKFADVTAHIDIINAFVQSAGNLIVQFD